MQFSPLNQVFLQWFAQFDKIRAVAGNSNQHILVVLGVFLCSPHGLGAHDVIIVIIGISYLKMVKEDILSGVLDQPLVVRNFSELTKTEISAKK